MTKQGHLMTTTAMFAVISAAIITGWVANPYSKLGNLWVDLGLFYIGMLVGSSAPDWLEMSRKEQGKWVRAIPHRTLTHWLPLWLGALWLVWAEQIIGFWMFELLIVGFLLSGILHILVDACSLSGVPLWTPFGKTRLKLGIYRTGGTSEMVFGMILVATSAISSWQMVTRL